MFDELVTELEAHFLETISSSELQLSPILEYAKGKFPPLLFLSSLFYIKTTSTSKQNKIHLCDTESYIVLNNIKKRKMVYSDKEELSVEAHGVYNEIENLNLELLKLSRVMFLYNFLNLI